MANREAIFAKVGRISQAHNFSQAFSVNLQLIPQVTMPVYFILLLALVVGLALGYYAGRRSLDDLRNEHERHLAELRRSAEVQAAEQRKENERRLELMAARLKNESERQMRERGTQLREENVRQLDEILGPLRNGIQEMRHAVQQADSRHLDSMSRLDESIKVTLAQARLVGERADKLAAALTGENKTQGNFGELRLRTLLEDMGLERGVQFDEQWTVKDENGQVVTDDETGRRLIPDVVLHFPDKRDVVIDSKVSLTAYKDYYEAKTDEQRKLALDRHVKSLQQHVKQLSAKNYAGHLSADRSRLDFVVMYVFSDSALSLALTAAPGLWKEAYDKGVFITSSQNLYALLRMLELSWKQQLQVQNQQKIVDQAALIVSRVQLFYERFLNVETTLSKTQAAFDSLRRMLLPGGQSIISAANKLVKLGAREDPRRRQTLPKDDNSEDEDDNAPELTSDETSAAAFLQNVTSLDS